MPLLLVALAACTESDPAGVGERERARRPSVTLPGVELVNQGSPAGSDGGGGPTTVRPYVRVGSQIQSDVRTVPLPGSLTFRVGPLPTAAALSFGYATTPVVTTPDASLALEVSISTDSEPASVAFATTISNIGRRARVEPARVRTVPRSPNPEILVDGRFGEAWISPTSRPTVIRIDLPRPTALTALSIGSDETARSSTGIPSKIRVALSFDGEKFGPPLKLDRVRRAGHQWHLLPGEPVQALRIVIVATHDRAPARIDEIVLTAERDLESLPNQLDRWNRAAIDLTAYEGRTIEVTFDFASLTPPADDRSVRAMLSGPRVDLAPEPGELNVVLISVDTVRSDRMSAFGYDRPTTPFLDGLVEKPGAVRFNNVRSTSTWTPPSHLAMMVGRTPFELQVHPSRSRMEEWRKDPARMTGLDPSVPTLASILRSRGYKTVAFASAGGTTGEFGLRNGFDVYDQSRNLLPATPLDYFGELVARTALVERWLEENRDHKFMLFLHTYVAHMPYKGVEFSACEQSEEASERCGAYLEKLYRADNRLRRGREWGGRLGSQYQKVGVLTAPRMGDLYDGGLLLVDEFLESVVGALDRFDLRGNTLVVITSDHGEPFGEHRSNHFKGEHGWGFYDEYLRVPLVLLVPGLERAVRSETPNSSVDIPPTVLDLLGIETTAVFGGRSLAPAIYGERHDLHERPIFYEVMATEQEADGFFIAASEGDFKILADPYDLYGGRHALYDVAADPGETADLAHQWPAIATDLLGELDRHLADAFGGLVVVDISTLGIPKKKFITAKIEFDRPVRLFEIAVRRNEEELRSKKRGSGVAFEAELALKGERRLLGFRPQSDQDRFTVRFESEEDCEVRIGSARSKADGSTVAVTVSDVAVPALGLQSKVGRGECSISVVYVRPAAAAEPRQLAPAEVLDDADREEVMEQMRALGYSD